MSGGRTTTDFSHQDPGFIDLVLNKKADVVRVYLPPDANTLLWVTDHVLKTWDRVNVIVAGKQPAPQWLTMDQAVKHCQAGIGVWEWASNDQGLEPDIVIACAGDVPTLETIAAVSLVREHLPGLKIRVVNVVDLSTMQPREDHPHGLSDREFDALFTTDKPVIFAYHGYPWLIHRLTYRRTNHINFHVHGYKEEGTTTTPFDMVVLNDLDRFHLASDVIDLVPGLAVRAAHIRQIMRDKLLEHRDYIVRHGEDMPEIRDWGWPYGTVARSILNNNWLVAAVTLSLALHAADIYVPFSQQAFSDVALSDVRRAILYSGKAPCSGCANSARFLLAC